MTDNTRDRKPGRVVLRTILVFGFIVVLGLIYFISAGSLKLVWGWVFSAIFFGFTIGMVLAAGEGLMAERTTVHKDAKPWDRYLSLVPALSILGMLVVGGLDAGRGHWTPDIPLWLHLLAAALLIGSLLINTWAVKTNRFYSSVVRIQTDRGHQVVDSGPYAYIRHPTYMLTLLFGILLPLLLGSLWALIPGVMGSVGITIRTALEDKTLQAELPGYAEYSQRVKYRLIPGIW
ncbi:MAG: isoprenylcysteine carboxylmethyltransferase family protein [Anaerolineaceae bacterium]